MKIVKKFALSLALIFSALFSQTGMAAGIVTYLYSATDYILVQITETVGGATSYGYYNGTDDIIPSMLQTSLSGCVPITLFTSQVNAGPRIDSVVYTIYTAKKTAGCPL